MLTALNKQEMLITVFPSCPLQRTRPAIRRKPICPQVHTCREPVMLAGACPPGAYLPLVQNLSQSIRPAIKRKPICPQALACREPVMLAGACLPGAYLPLVQNLSPSIRPAIRRSLYARRRLPAARGRLPATPCNKI